MLIEYNKHQWRLKFVEEEQTCKLCFDDKKGKEFKILDCCKEGYYCTDCLSNMCELLITTGDIFSLTCPNCRAPFSPNFLRSFVSPALYSRWDSLALKKSLESVCFLLFFSLFFSFPCFLSFPPFPFSSPALFDGQLWIFFYLISSLSFSSLTSFPSFLYFFVSYPQTSHCSLCIP